MRLITTFLFMVTFFTVNTSFIFCCYIKNVVAEDITHSEYTSILTVGVEDALPSIPSISSSNSSSTGKTITDYESNTSSDTLQVTSAKDNSVHLTQFNFLQRLIERFPHLTLLLYLFPQKSRRWG